ncbi:MAG TPA: tetratricopeptide repeat protein, partial [Streptosporangiaceae bacterium]|nr:tetratricopeptide repeat protein [Streptosporangiaceae bacterium]
QAGLAEIEATLAWAEAARYPAVRSECLWRRSEVLAFAGQAGEAAESAEQALAIATGIRHAACTAAALRGLGIAWETAGKPARAEEAFKDSLTAAEGNPFFAAWASARLGACLARQGHPLEAAPHVRAALSAGPPLTRHEARWAHAELLAARGEDQDCRTAATQALHEAEDGGYLILLPRLRELAGS